MAFITAHQLDIMLFMSGICAILAFMALATDTPSRAKKNILALMAFAAMLLLLAERFSYLYRGDISELGFWMVRVSNGLVYFTQVLIPWLVTQFLKDLYRNEGNLRRTPFFLQLCDVLFILATVLIIASQFTGLYYYFDEQNLYHRSQVFPLAYSFPLLMVLFLGIGLIQHRKRLRSGIVTSVLLSITFTAAMAIVQLFWYGLSLTSMTMVFVVIVFYVYVMKDLGRTVVEAKANELESYKAAEQKVTAMFEQTAEALATAIDAKDKYTRGHSARVAALSKKIAKEAGFSDEECEQVYFAALLHDVGKIGIPDRIINKDGALTPDEYEQIKYHPVLGYHILSSIKASPALSVGAHYHHERYDGTGYPDGLRGEDIPALARIIAVADAYDAMASTRIYHSEVPQEEAKDELRNGSGKQFDPKYTEILLQILDNKHSE